MRIYSLRLVVCPCLSICWLYALSHGYHTYRIIPLVKPAAGLTSTRLSALQSPYENALEAKKVIFKGASLFVSSLSTQFTDLLPVNTGKVIIPLELIDSVYCINYTVDGITFRGIVDTGSPFLMTTTICSRMWGCAPQGYKFAGTGYAPSVEIYGGQEYDVDWKMGSLQFPNTRVPNRMQQRNNVVFAAVGLDVLRRPGGVFIGLIKKRAKSIKPTLLEQLGYSSFKFDTKHNFLTLSHQPLIPEFSRQSVIKLVDLRPFGAPVGCYAAKVKSLAINGVSVYSAVPIVAVFDTGVTGCMISEDLFNFGNIPTVPRRVRVVLEGEDEGDVVVEAFATRQRIFVVTAARFPWFVKRASSNVNLSRSTYTSTSQTSSSPSIPAIQSSSIVAPNSADAATTASTTAATTATTAAIDASTVLETDASRSSAEIWVDGVNMSDEGSKGTTAAVTAAAAMASAACTVGTSQRCQEEEFGYAMAKSAVSAAPGDVYAHVVSLGLAFMEDKILTVDINEARLTLVDDA